MPSLHDQRFLITGGTGSFEQTMVARLLKAGAAEVRILSRDEAKQDDLRRRLSDDRAAGLDQRLFMNPSRQTTRIHVDGKQHVSEQASCLFDYRYVLAFDTKKAERT